MPDENGRARFFFFFLVFLFSEGVALSWCSSGSWSSGPLVPWSRGPGLVWSSSADHHAFANRADASKNLVSIKALAKHQKSLQASKYMLDELRKLSVNARSQVIRGSGPLVLSFSGPLVL